MSCNHPLFAFWTGSYTDTGKKDYYISSNVGDIVSLDLVRRSKKVITSAVKLKEINGKVYLTDPVLIPCGKCVGCRMTRARNWKVRLCHEAEQYKDKCWFITLTYRENALPINQDGEPYISKRHCQLFLKHLRTFTGRQFRYFLCGEYGSDTHRPHYHIILFGELDDLVPFAFNRYHSAAISHCWKHGLHEVSPAEQNSMAYVAGYVEKKQKDPCFESYPVKPFVMMSTKPGIGFNYLQRISGEDNHVYGNFGNIHYSPIPRAYLKKFEDQEWFDALKNDMKLRSKSMNALNAATYGTTNKELQGFIKDDISMEKLEKVRIEKI